MNRYFENLKKIEFVVTYACTGRCKHCSEGEHKDKGERINPEIAANAVKKIAAEYSIKTVMAFGGEPLLYTDAVYAIMSAARDLNIEKRQIITNGYFTTDENKMHDVAARLAECGVNDLLLSADAFHMETIPLDIVKRFASLAKNAGIPINIQPAWLVAKEHDNPYNRKTKEILAEFSALGITENDGNVIFPEGNAKVYLAEYFDGKPVENPYIEDPYDVTCISFEPNGDVLGSDVYKNDIIDIIKGYEPK